MATPVIMPRQGQSVESCILTEWYKDEGDTVEPGDLLFAYETDKAAFEEEAPSKGILLAKLFQEGDEVPVLNNVAVIGEKGENIDQFKSGEPLDKAEAAIPDPPSGDSMGTDQEPEMPEKEPVVSSGSSLDKRAISPRARNLAEKRRIIWEGIEGTGPGGRIIERDIQREIESGKRLTPLARKKLDQAGLTVPVSGKAPFGKISSKELVKSSEIKKGKFTTDTEDYTDRPLTNIRKIIAEAMHRSLSESAQLTHHLSANASGMLQLRAEVKKRAAEGSTRNITLNDMVCFAVIRALKKNPEANAHFLDGTIRQFHHVNLGLAVDTGRGLLVPVLPHADDFSLSGLSSQLLNLAGSAREGSLSPDLLAPDMASFTVSNLGNYGVEMFTPVINLPQVAILGVNTILQRPAVFPDGNFGFLPFIGLSLTYDHRAIDGGPATRFLAEIKTEIEQLSPDHLKA